MNKNVKKIVLASMVSSMLLTTNVKAEEVGTVRVSTPTYPVAQGIGRYSVTAEEEDFLQDLFGDVYQKNEQIPEYETVVETEDNISVEFEPEQMIEDLEEDIEVETEMVEEQEESLNNADNTVISYFQTAKEKLVQYAQSEDFATLKREAKKVFTDGIDFLFFDGTIDGITREQMTEEGKKDVIRTIEGTLDFLDEYFPGFSESFGEKYSVAKIYLSEKFVKVLDRVKGWIGESTYEGVSNMGRDFMENLEVLGDILGDEYQEWKLK